MEKLNGLILAVDKSPLLWSVIPLLVVFFSYYFLLGKNCVIEINDQLDETLFTYVLNAKYMFSNLGCPVPPPQVFLQWKNDRLSFAKALHTSKAAEKTRSGHLWKHTELPFHSWPNH